MCSVPEFEGRLCSTLTQYCCILCKWNCLILTYQCWLCQTPLLQDLWPEKVWACLYTCCVTRAVNLDLILTCLLKHSFVVAKDIAPGEDYPIFLSLINGKVFKAAAKVIKNIVSDRNIQQYLSQASVKWSFNLANLRQLGGEVYLKGWSDPQKDA